MLRSFKKASLLVGVLACTLLLQGCIAEIMSAAGGILSGLGKAFGGQTGQILGQIGQVLGGVGQAFGQQQQGIAGQLAGQAGLGGGGPLQGNNPAQGPLGANNPLNQIFPPNVAGGNVQLPQAPGVDILQKVQGLLQQANIQQPNAQQIQQAAQQAGADPSQIPNITTVILQQVAQGNGQVTVAPPPPGAGQGAPAPQANNPAAPAINPQLPGIPQFGGNQQVAGILQAVNGVVNLINIFNGQGGQQGGVQIQVPRPPTVTVTPPGLNFNF